MTLRPQPWGLLRVRSGMRLKNSVVAATLVFAAVSVSTETSVAGTSTPKSARPVAGGYYVGTTEKGKHAEADVSPDKSQVSAASFNLVCGGQKTQAAMQNMKIKKSKGVYHFSGKGDEALLFTPSYLSESGKVTVKGRFVAHHKIKGTFRVQSPTCGDSGAIAYTLKLKTS